MLKLNGHYWANCSDCGKLVKLTGWLRGIHLCLTQAEIEQKQALAAAVQRQRDARPADSNALLGRSAKSL